MDNKQLDRIVAAKTDLVIDYPFFGLLAMRLRLIEDDLIPTMGTDGTRLAYNPKFVETLNDAELKGVLCHEVLHCSNGHPWRKEWREHVRWNHAADYAINPIVLDCGMKLPANGLFKKEWAGQSAEEIYPKIKTLKISGCGFGEILDPLSGAAAEADNAATEQDWKISTMQAARAAQMAGKFPAALEKLIDEIANPKVDWKAALQSILQQALTRDDYTWTRPNARYFASSLFLPSLYSETRPPISMYVDASYSCWSKEILEAFLAEMNGIKDQCKPEMVYVDYFDTQVNEGTEFGPDETITLKATGGGGTDFRPIFDHLRDSRREPATVVILTDGYGPFPDENPLSIPVVWAMNTAEVAPWGTTLDIR